MSDVLPLVSICCLTYNHAAFIRKCLDGFLMQQTSFPVEILIHDDASTDGTDDIVKEYAAKYPDKIFPLFETENKYSNGYVGKMDITFNYSRAKGKYIASCEGDDYWIDPLKLQKQVDFMEANPDYSVCWHRTKHWIAEKDKWSDDDCGTLTQGKEGVDIDLSTFFSRWCTQPLSMVFRKSMFNPEWQKKYRHYRDTYEIYHLLKEGKGYLFSFVGGVYVKHGGGIAAMNDYGKACFFELESAEELFRENHDPITYDYWKNVVLWSMDYFNREGLRKVLIKRCLNTSFIGSLEVCWTNMKHKVKKCGKTGLPCK